LSFFLSTLSFLSFNFDSRLSIILNGSTESVIEKLKIIILCFSIPIVSGWLQYKGETVGLYSHSLGYCISVTLGTILLASLICRSLQKISTLSMVVEKSRDNIYHHSLSLEERIKNRTLELTQSLEQLVISEKNFTAITQSIRMGLIAFDDKGIINFLNLGAQKLFGFNENEIMGNTVERILDLNFILEVSSNPAIDDFEGTGLHKEGMIIPIEIRASKWSMQSIPCTLLLIHDLTEKKRFENELELQKNNLINSMKMKSLGEMAGSIAHEINTPLGTICLRLSEIKRNLIDEDYYTVFEDVRKIEETVFRINKIIKGLKRFAGDGEQENLVSISTKILVDDLLALCNDRLKNKGIKVIVGKEIDYATIFCKPVQTVQCLLNLFNNSCDALESLENDHKWISIDVAQNQEFSEITIIDSGTGIPTEFRNKIMQPFFTTKSVGNGVGLGLSITKSMMENQNGYLKLEESTNYTSFVLGFKISKS